MQIESLNDNEIIMEYNGEKYKITPFRGNRFSSKSLSVFEYELMNTTFDEIEFNDEIYSRLKKNILYNKQNNSFELISFDPYKFDGFEKYLGSKEVRIESKNDKFIFCIKYYTLSLSLGDNFTKNGLIINDEDVFKVFKKLDNEALLKLKNMFIEKDHKFIMDVYKNKDFERKYKIFYENEYIEIQEEDFKEEIKKESKEEIEQESKEEIKKESEEESKKKTKPAIAKFQPQEQPKEEAPPAGEAGQPQPIQPQPGQLESQRIQLQPIQPQEPPKKKPKPKIGKIQQQESDDDETISDFSDNSIDESESED